MSVHDPLHNSDVFMQLNVNNSDPLLVGRPFLGRAYITFHQLKFKIYKQ